MVILYLSYILYGDFSHTFMMLTEGTLPTLSQPPSHHSLLLPGPLPSPNGRVIAARLLLREPLQNYAITVSQKMRPQISVPGYTFCILYGKNVDFLL